MHVVVQLRDAAKLKAGTQAERASTAKAREQCKGCRKASRCNRFDVLLELVATIMLSPQLQMTHHSQCDGRRPPMDTQPHGKS